MKTLGIIGGLGPLATAVFLEMVTEKTQADTDQEHLDVLLRSKPQIPDRTAYILGRSKESPVPEMIAVGRELAGLGAQVIAIPCITAHYFHDELEDGVGVPILHAVRECAEALKKRGVLRAGVLATEGTIETGLFRRFFDEAGIEAITPDTENQRKVTHMIYGEVKAGKPLSKETLLEVGRHLRDKGAEVCLLGCTELSVSRVFYGRVGNETVKRNENVAGNETVKRNENVAKNAAVAGNGRGDAPPFLDVMELLAEAAVKACGAKLRA